MEDERKGLPSASSLDADIRCLGRRNLIASTGAKGKDSKASLRGEKIHSALEGAIEIDDLTNSDAKTASICAYQEGALIEKYGVEGSEMVREERIWLSNDSFEPVFSCKPDSIYITDNVILNVNYKTGFSYIAPIADNWQVRSECITIMENYPSIAKNNGIVVGALIHPHHPCKIQSQDVVYKVEDLIEYRKQLDVALISMRDPDAIRTPNHTSCQYCPAKLACAEHQQWKADLIKRSPVELKMMTPEQLGSRLTQVKTAMKELEEEEKEIKAIVKADPASIEGYEYKFAGSVIEFRDLSAVERIIAEHIGQDAVDNARSLSSTALLKSCKAFWLAQGEKLNDNDAKNKLVQLLGDNARFVNKEKSLKAVGPTKL